MIWVLCKRKFILCFILFLGIVSADFLTSGISTNAKELAIRESTLRTEQEEKVELRQLTDLIVHSDDHSKELMIVSDSGYQLDIEKTMQQNRLMIEGIQQEAAEQAWRVKLKEEHSSDEEIIIIGQFIVSGEQMLTVKNSQDEESLTYIVSEENKKEMTEEAPTTSSDTVLEDTENYSPLNQAEQTEEAFIGPKLVESKATIQPRATTPDPNFDWNKLNTDGLDLSTFTEVTKNTPVKLTGGAFDNKDRTYYLFFGHTAKANTYTYATQTFNKVGNMYASLGRFNDGPLMSPMMIGVKKQVGQETSTIVFNYDYHYEYTGSYITASAGFDIGELTADGTIGKSRTRSESINSVPRDAGAPRILKQYIKDNEIVSYGYIQVANTNGTQATASIEYRYIRVHGYRTNIAMGEIRYDISFYNDSDVSKSYAVNYGMHVDVGGNHTSSKLYSNGTDGLYFHEALGTKADGLAARLYFYMGANRYTGVNGPMDFKVGNLGGSALETLYNVNAWRKDYYIDRMSWTIPLNGAAYLTPYAPWDPIGTKGELYPLDHPVFVYRWNPITVEPGGTGTASLDLSIDEPTLTKPTATKTYTNVTSPNEEVTVGDRLKFELTAKNEGTDSFWKNIIIKDVLPEQLVIDPKTIQITQPGTTVSTALPETSYDAATRTLTSPPSEAVGYNQTYTVTFEALVGGEGNETVVNKMTAGNERDDEQASASVEIPITAKGELSFISAPTSLDFGQNIKISMTDEMYPLQATIGEGLVIQDTRKVKTEPKWSVTAKLLSEFTSESGNVLVNGLRYRTAGKEMLFSMSESILITERKTISAEPVNLSEQWGQDGPVLAVPAGKAQPESYQASIRWQLQEVPANE